MTVATAPKLNVDSTILGYRRSRTAVHPNQVLMRLPDVRTAEDAKFYVGKVVAYYYTAPTKVRGSRVRCVWGKVIGVHGNSGVVRARFKRNLSGNCFAKTAKVFMYPSTI